jgi:hypothetical protein
VKQNGKANKEVHSGHGHVQPVGEKAFEAMLEKSANQELREAVDEVAGIPLPRGSKAFEGT